MQTYQDSQLNLEEEQRGDWQQSVSLWWAAETHSSGVESLHLSITGRELNKNISLYVDGQSW